MASYGAQMEMDINEYATMKEAIIVDLRSDTVTKPSPNMRKAMFDAEVGDDVYREDPTVNELERKAARMLGKEDSLFVPSGTMGNLIAIMVHCNERGSEAYCGASSHVVLHEQGGAAQIAGVTICQLPDTSYGSFDLLQLESNIRNDRLHEPISKLVIVENPSDGKIVDRCWLAKLSELAKKRNLKLHMDGARLWNAVVASGIPAEDIVDMFDSVTFCLSKGLGAPAGSLLCGSRSFVSQARRLRKVLGGGMRQSGILAAAGIVALDEMIPILKRDHERTEKMLNEIAAICPKICDNEPSSTNMLFLNLFYLQDLIDAKEFVTRLAEVDDDSKNPRVIVRALALSQYTVRFVIHRDVNDDMLSAAIRKIKYVLER